MRKMVSSAGGLFLLASMFTVLSQASNEGIRVSIDNEGGDTCALASEEARLKRTRL
jgi:hypothetical protein